MRTQIGWYDPESQRFCYSEVKERCKGYACYVVPVFAEDERDEIPTSPCEAPRAVETGLLVSPGLVPGLLWTQAVNRLLVNQQKMMETVRLSVTSTSAIGQHLSEACARTDNVIETLRKFEEPGRFAKAVADRLIKEPWPPASSEPGEKDEVKRK